MCPKLCVHIWSLLDVAVSGVEFERARRFLEKLWTRDVEYCSSALLEVTYKTMDDQSASVIS